MVKYLAPGHKWLGIYLHSKNNNAVDHSTMTLLTFTHLILFYNFFSLHPLFPGANEVDQIAKIHDIMGTPDASILNKLRKWAIIMDILLVILATEQS